MNSPIPSSACACCPMNRRHFLGRGTAAAVGTLATLSSSALLVHAAARRKTRIRIVYSLHGATQTQPDWPNQGFQFGPVMETLHHELSQRCKDFEFVSSQASGEEQAKAIVASDQ
ncbi:MAG TPA: hypothetical protein VHI52_07585, partial [Verrucomicrobiae bacterium]|nr:hypothetical protein [Verrucomicrobiae bacterium]